MERFAKQYPTAGDSVLPEQHLDPGADGHSEGGEGNGVLTSHEPPRRAPVSGAVHEWPHSREAGNVGA